MGGKTNHTFSYFLNFFNAAVLLKITFKSLQPLQQIVFPKITATAFYILHAFYKCGLTFHQQQVESNSSPLASGVALVTCLTNRMWQKRCCEVSEARSQEVLQLPPGPPNIGSERLPLVSQLAGSEKAKPPGEDMSRGCGGQPQPTTCTNSFPHSVFTLGAFEKQ